MEKIKFRGIDSWNRPVFKSLERKNFYGSVNKLFDMDATKEEVLKKVSEFDLCFFGNFFGCEPMGTPAEHIEIVG